MKTKNDKKQTNLFSNYEDPLTYYSCFSIQRSSYLNYSNFKHIKLQSFPNETELQND